MARITIAGGHGHVAQLLTERLAARGDEVVGLIRSEDQVDDLRARGAQPVMLDLEEATVEEYAAAIDGSEAVVFAAGAGPGSGADRKETVDFGAAVKLRRAAEQAGVGRYVMVSAMGTDDPPQDDSVFSVYLRAKARADRDLVDSDLEWTIVRPGGLTDDPGTGRVAAGRHVEPGEIPRADVAAVLATVLGDDGSTGRIFEVVSGETSVVAAIAGLGPDTKEL